MKMNNFNMFFLMFLSCNSMAAFNGDEVTQLSAINKEASGKYYESLKALNLAISDTIDNNPEKKEVIMSLEDKWRDFSREKCNFENFDSKGTDAEISLNFDCMTKEANTESLYFNSLLP
ncbi:hypothetical protein [Erwinia billingiae]|uniref:hypothetical protein n=1 Tax=Erwinia billingiae TaxID=182337 RepID=UPI002246E0F4|nr:hypothetical protein [Erwinia billingiae]MCX0499665.1 hypothetical protein [Erwinia billingiae]